MKIVQCVSTIASVILLALSIGLLVSVIKIRNQEATEEITTPAVTTTSAPQLGVQCEENVCSLEFCLIHIYSDYCAIECRDHIAEDTEHPISEIISRLLEQGVSFSEL